MYTSLVKTVYKPARAWESNDGESGRTRRYLKDPTIIRGRLKAMIVWGEPLDRFAKRVMQGRTTIELFILTTRKTWDC